MAKTTNVIALLDSKGQDASGALAACKAAEAKLQAEQKVFHESKGLKHEADKHGLARGQVSNIAKRFVSPASWELFGDDLVSEIWDAL